MLFWVFNVGSTGLKWQLIELPPESINVSGRLEPGERIRATGRGRLLNTDRAVLSYDFEEKSVHRQTRCRQPATREVLDRFAEWLAQDGFFSQIDACVFKTVHLQGAESLPEVVLLTEEILQRMERYVCVAPAHNPPYLRLIREVQRSLSVPTLGAFETVFHQSIAASDYLYAVPREWHSLYGVRRYGFHGASHRYIAERLAELMSSPHRAISIHLGGSSSICALLDGRSILTSMGFSPQGILPNATRCGELDPFALIWLAQQPGLSLEILCEQLVTDSGLAGLSGIARGNFREIVEKRVGGTRIAFEHLVHQIVQLIGSYTARLRGLDALVFTGGIGEHEPILREAVCEQLDWMGIVLDRKANRSVVEELISAAESPVAVWVIPMHEELIIARRALHWDGWS